MHAEILAGGAVSRRAINSVGQRNQTYFCLVFFPVQGPNQSEIPLAWIIHECCREAFEAETRRGFSQVRLTAAYLQSVEEAEREKPRRARGSDDVAGIHE